MEIINLELLNLGRALTRIHENIEISFEISPNDFLKFAEFDLTANYEHHLVNSLSNTKRALTLN
jgi:hypothetical protein